MAIINPPAWPIDKGEKNALNILLNAFRIAINGALSVFGMVDGFVDEFEDETGIDTTDSLNEVYDSTNDLYESDLVYGSDQTGSGTASASSEAEGAAANAFANDGTSTFWGYSGTGSGSLTYDFGSGVTKTIQKYTIRARGSFENQSPKAWTLEGSNNGSAWTTLDTRSGVTGWTAGEIKTFTFSNSTAYRYYRISITENDGGGNTTISEVEFMEGTVNDMTLISEPQTAEVEPKTARIVVFEEDVDAVTLNTDLKAYVSRDSGVTWTQITLADEGDYGSGKRILTGQVGITAQPSGTAMRYKIETDNNKKLKLHGVALTWD